MVATTVIYVVTLPVCVEAISGSFFFFLRISRESALFSLLNTLHLKNSNPKSSNSSGGEGREGKYCRLTFRFLNVLEDCSHASLF